MRTTSELERTERIVRVHCQVCGASFAAVAPIDQSPLGLTNRRDALEVHLLVESPSCERRTDRVS